MREAGKSYLWYTETWFRTKPGTTPRIRLYARTSVSNSDLPAPKHFHKTNLEKTPRLHLQDDSAAF